MIRFTDFFIILTLLLSAIAVILFYFYRYRKNVDKRLFITDFQGLKKVTMERLNQYVSFTKDKTSYGFQTEIAESIRNCCSGRTGDREVVKTLIIDFLRDELEITEEETDKLLKEMGTEGKYVLMLTALEHNQENEGFLWIWNNCLYEKCCEVHEITDEMIDEAFLKVSDRVTFKTKVKALGELLYAYSVGLGAIDMLNYETGILEEIQLGMSGFAKEEYDYRDVLKSREKTVKYARDSIHILVSGQIYRLSFLSFHTDDELVRVLRNLIKTTGAAEITRKNPKVITDTVDGRRITVSRPPFTDSWAGLIRKFDNTVTLKLNDMYEDTELLTTLQEVLKNSRSIAVTGEMAAGKTTLLRALLCELGDENSFRIIESESFELDMRKYLPNANTLTLRTGDTESFDEILAFAKKTTGQIFVLGEISSMSMARLSIETGKLAHKLFFTAHYKTTEDMLAGFASAILNTGGFKDYGEAEAEAIRALDYDIHLVNIDGKRQIQYINRINENGEVINVWKAKSQN